MLKFNNKNGIAVYIVQQGDPKITANDIEEDFAYVIADDGTYAKRKNFMYEGLFKVTGKLDILGETEAEVTPLMELKIPEKLFQSIERFFKHIYDKFSSEVQCFLYYHPGDNKWAYAIPEQKVNSAHVDYDEKQGATYIVEDDLSVGLDELPGNADDWVKIGTIHSHASMGAFHSGTDDKDEFGFDGIHITIGNFNSHIHSYACRVMYGKTAVKKELNEVVDFPTPPGTYPEKLEDRVSKNESVVTSYSGTTNAPVKGSGYGYNGYGYGYGGYGYRYEDDYDDYSGLYTGRAGAAASASGGTAQGKDPAPAHGRAASRKRGKTTTYQYKNGTFITKEVL